MCYEEGQGSNTASIVLTLSAVIGILSKELTKDLSSRMPHDLCLKQFLLGQNYEPDLNCYLISCLQV